MFHFVPWQTGIMKFDSICRNVCHLGRTELQNAVLKGDENCVEQLLQNRASVDATDRSVPNPWSVPSCHVLTMAAMSAWVLDVVCLVYAKAGQPYTWPPTRSPDQAT